MKTTHWVIGALLFLATHELLAQWGLPAPFYFGALAIGLLLVSAGRELLTSSDDQQPLSMTEYDQLAADLSPGAGGATR